MRQRSRAPRLISSSWQIRIPTPGAPTSPRERERSDEKTIYLYCSAGIFHRYLLVILLFATADVGSHANKTPLTLCCLRSYASYLLNLFRCPFFSPPRWNAWYGNYDRLHFQYLSYDGSRYSRLFSSIIILDVDSAIALSRKRCALIPRKNT